MDFTFLSVTFVLIIFLLISYFLDVIKLSTPLLLIYFIFCFSYLMEEELNDDSQLVFKNLNKKDEIGTNNDKLTKITIKPEDNDTEDKKILDVSKPIVSFNPKPIVIDSNLIIQKDKDKNTEIVPKSEKSSIDIDKNKKENLIESLKLNEVMICRGVYKRNPIKPGFVFTNNVDSLFCYTKISNKGSKQEIKHLWYYEDKLATSVVYNIKTSHNYRSWSKKTIPPGQVGQWRVDIVDSKDKILGTRNFQISSLNDEF